MRNCKANQQQNVHGQQSQPSQRQQREIKQEPDHAKSEVEKVEHDVAAAGDDLGGGQVPGASTTNYRCCCEHDAIMNQVVDIETHVKIVRNSLLFLCRSYLLEKQIV